jgi:uncharacterized membrane protein
MEKLRKQTPDLLKGIAVILMIQVHLTEQFAQQGIYNSLIGEISLFLGGPPVAPVFVAIMGYLLATTKKSQTKLFIRGIKLLVLGLLLNIGLNTNLLIHIFNGNFNLNPYEYIFGVDILLFAGLSIVFITLIRPIFKNNFILYLILAFVISFISPYLHNFAGDNSSLKYVNAFLWGNYRWSYFPLFPWLSYPLIGYSFQLFKKKYLRNKPNDLFRQSKLIIIIVLGIILIFTIKYAGNISCNLEKYYNHNIIFFVWNIMFMCFWATLVSFIETKTGKTYIFKYIKWLGKNITALYVFQWLIIGNIATEIYKTQNINKLIFWYLGIIAFSSLLVLIRLKIKAIYKSKQFIIL